MPTTQYIGSRYVPLLADPVEWSSTKEYEPLTIVTHEGNSYTSRQFVPKGIDIDNETYWALTGNYNAQIEQYRRETAQAVETAQQLTDDAVSQVDTWLTDAQEQYGKKPFAFNTVEAMQRNYALLYEGAICHTNGFNAAGDGGAAWYVMTSTGTANDMDVLTCGNLFANLITEYFVTPEMFGAYGNNVNDDSRAINRIIDFASENDITIIFNENKIYSVASPISISTPIFINLNGCTLKYIGNNSNTFIKYHFDSGNIVKSKLGIINGTIDANNRCDIAIEISGGKRIELGNLRVFKFLNTGIKLTNADDNIWEMNAHDLTIDGKNSVALANYCMYITGVTDSYFNRLVLSNAKISWLYNNTATNHFKDVHGYAYPAENRPDYGMTLAGNSNIYENIVIDTPYKIGINSSGVANIFKNVELLNFSGENDRIGIMDNDFNTYETIVAYDDCDIVIKSNATNAISVRGFINFRRPNKDLEFNNDLLPWTFDIDLQTSRAVNKFTNDFVHRNLFATANTEYTVEFPVKFRSILDYDVFVVQKTANNAYPYAINKGATSVGITFYAPSTTSVPFDVYIKPYKW